MPESRGHVLGKIAWDALPSALSIGFYFGGNAMAAGGSFFVAAETAGFFVGVGAIGAGLAMAAAPVLVIAAIAVAVGDDKTVAEISKTADDLTPFLSPGVLALAPFSPFVTPHDPMLFARTFGPGVDLLTGGLSPKKLDNFQAYVQGLAGLSAWKSDAINLGLYHLSNQTGSNPTPSQYPSAGYPMAPAPPSSPPQSGPTGDPDQPSGYPYDPSYPGDGDFFGGASGSGHPVSGYIEGYTESIEGDSSNGTDSGGIAPGSDNSGLEDGDTDGNGTANEGNQQEEGSDTSDAQSGGENSGGDDEGNDGSGGSDDGGDDGGGED